MAYDRLWKPHGEGTEVKKGFQENKPELQKYAWSRG